MSNQTVFELDTKNMGTTAMQCKSIAEKMKDLRSELERARDDLLKTWVGKGRNEFEKQFRLLDQQFSDIVDDTMDTYEAILKAEGDYIQLDTDLAKQADGVDRKF